MIKYPFVILVILSFVTTIMSYIFEKFKTFNIILCIRFLHYFITYFSCLYYFLFNKVYDIYYILIYSITIIHWLFTNNGCILSKWEDSYYNSKNNYLKIFVGNNIDIIIIPQICLMTLNLLLVIRRYNFKYYNYLFCAVIIILQFYLILKYRKII
jgi:hypothetical protein